MKTVYSRFRAAAEKFKRRPAVYWKSGKKWHSLNYLEFLRQIDSLAEGLKSHGVSQGERIAIMSENRPEWLLSDLAINKIGAVSVPIHVTSNQPFIEHLLKDSMSGFLIVSGAALKKHFSAVSQAVENYKIKAFVIKSEINHLTGLREEVEHNFINFEDLLTAPADRVEPAGAAKDLASIIYTSGTTGEPKGVMLTNENFLSNTEAALETVKILPSDIFLSFLPLSHVLERMAGSYVPVFSGASIAYVPDLKYLTDSLREVRPTIFIGVPKIFEKSYEKIITSLEKKNRLIRKFFYYSLGRRCPGWLKVLADKIFYAQIRKNFGGRLRFVISGGASINERIIKFFGKIGLKIVEGYGLTETSPIVAMNSLEKTVLGTVGRPLEGVEVKIALDKEILVRGKNVMFGYWHKEDLTRQHFTEDGFFRTGDLGFLDREGFLTIIGRKKELIITSNGKKISPEKVEAVLNLSPLIYQSLVVGHGRSHLSCLIVPDKSAIAKKFGEGRDPRKCIEEEIEEINNLLMSHEKIKNFILLDDAFTVEEGELTATLKVRRSVIEHKYRREIEGLY